MEKYFVVEDSCIKAVAFGLDNIESSVNSVLYSEILTRAKDVKAKGNVEDLVVEFTDIVTKLQNCLGQEVDIIRGVFTLKPFVSFPILLIIEGGNKVTGRELYGDIAAMVKLAVDSCSKNVNVKRAFSSVAKQQCVHKFVETDAVQWHAIADSLSMRSIMSQCDLSVIESRIFSAIMNAYDYEIEA